MSVLVQFSTPKYVHPTKIGIAMNGENMTVCHLPLTKKLWLYSCFDNSLVLLLAIVKIYVLTWMVSNNLNSTLSYTDILWLSE